MNIEWQIAPLSEWQADALLFFTFEQSSAKILPGLDLWMREAGPWISQSPALKDFQGKADQTVILYAPSEKAGIPRVVCVGLGPAEKFDMEKWRGAVAAGLQKCREWQWKQPALPIAAFEGLPIESQALALEEALVGGLLGLYQYDALKTRDRESVSYPEKLLLVSESEPDDNLRKAVSSAEAITSGVRLARDLTFAPGNLSTPTFLMETAGHLANRYGFRSKIIDMAEAAALGMGAFTAVARGSREPAYIIILESVPPGTEQDRPLVFIGKGITFDTGGISIKPSDKMEAMKHDMAGAAAVLGMFETLGRLDLKKRVAGILPCTENMPDGQAYKPGDVLSTLAGLTVEVISTDAEGRLILADALAYAVRFLNPAVIIDIATLTGACIVALGERVGAIMGNREDLNARAQQIAMAAGERFWPLPLWDFYFEALKSDVADFKNVGARSGGTIVAGAFLKQFIPNEIPWIHLDIAGPAWTDKDLPGIPKGATGFGVRTFVEVIRRWPLLDA